MNKTTSTALLLIRLTVGIIFLAHAMQKLFGVFGGTGMEGTANMLESLEIYPPLFWAWVLALTETIGSLLLILGIIPRTGAAFLGIVMIVAISQMHLPRGFFVAQGGLEFALLLLVNCIVIILMGGGNYSVFNRW